MAAGSRRTTAKRLLEVCLGEGVKRFAAGGNGERARRLIERLPACDRRRFGSLFLDVGTRDTFGRLSVPLSSSVIFLTIVCVCRGVDSVLSQLSDNNSKPGVSFVVCLGVAV